MTVCASVSFLVDLGLSGRHTGTILALMAGGVLALSSLLGGKVLRRLQRTRPRLLAGAG